MYKLLIPVKLMFECSVISKLFHFQMPAKARLDEDARSEDEEVEDDFSTAGGWAQGLAKGVFAHKKSLSGKRKLKSPKKQSRYELYHHINQSCQLCIVVLDKFKTNVSADKVECFIYIYTYG